MRKIHRPFVVSESGDGNHLFIWLGLDEADAEKGVLTNQYLVVDNGHGMLIDPGGYFVFQRLVEAVSEFIDPGKVEAIFYSHQDPDVVGSLNLVVEFFPRATIYISKLWSRFIPHLGVVAGLNVVEIPDEGMDIRLGEAVLRAVPAHFLHSPGNFTLYDPVVKTLFSADIGASVFPPGKWYLFVEDEKDFREHVKYMEGFHRRYLASSKALKNWLKGVTRFEVETVAPQHGAIMRGEAAKMFLEWLSGLENIGVDLLYP